MDGSPLAQGRLQGRAGEEAAVDYDNNDDGDDGDGDEDDDDKASHSKSNNCHLKVRCTARGGNPAPTLMWRLGDAWVEAEPTTEELEEGTVRMIFEDGYVNDVSL